MKGLSINGIFYSPADLSRGIFPEGETWRKEISLFLQEWFDNNDFVTGYTSGSTGAPKEIKLLKKDMLASARITNDFFRIESGDHLLLCLSPFYIAGKMMIVRTLLAGARLTAAEPASCPQIPEGQPLKLAAMVPMQVETLLNSSDAPALFSCIKQLIIGGAPVSPGLTSALQGIATACFATYGMTETVSHIALKRLNGKEASGDYFALGEVEFETDKRDCLIIKTPHLSGQAFITNDVVRLNGRYHFEWIGRYDNIINSGGVKLSPEAIENKLSAIIPGRFFVTSQPDDLLGEKVVLVIEGEPFGEKESGRIKQLIQQCLSRFEIPKTICFRQKFKETYSGKVIRGMRSLSD